MDDRPSLAANPFERDANSMTAAEWREGKRVFQTALELPPDAWDEFLESACPDGTARKQVAAMLSTLSYEGREWDHSVLEQLMDIPPPDCEGQIGPYRLIREIGRGGMGRVFLAERADRSFERKVALKLLRPEFPSGRSRVMRESRVLAPLDHPNIARILDAAVTAGGWPYLVMDYVDGVNILEYCSTGQLSVKERVSLFADCCAAVQYVHENLIVHRDLKPGNILVNREGVPKLLDFGIAKMLPSEASEERQPTRTVAPWFTPGYASPEQFRGDPVTVATDVYSLGVILCEVLTGQTPYKTAHLGWADVGRLICEHDPSQPSMLVPHGSKLRRILRGELDSIILKALERDPRRRYSSAEALREDLCRYLAGFPIRARKATRPYRAFKFIRRHQFVVAAALTVAIALSSTSLIALRHKREAELQRAIAQRRFEQVHTLADSLVFEMDGVIREIPGSVPARRLLVHKALTYLDGLANEAGNDTGLQTELAAAYLQIGDVQGDPFEPNLGESALAAESYDKARGILDRLARRKIRTRDFEMALAGWHLRSGDLLGHPLAGQLNYPGAIREYHLAEALVLEILKPGDDSRADRLLSSIRAHL